MSKVVLVLTSYLVQPTWAKNRCFSMTHILQKEIPKSTIGVNPIFGIHLVSCFQVIEFDPHYVKYKCIHLFKSDSNTNAHI